MHLDLLRSIRKPARYLGNERNAARTPAKGDLRVGLAFPDHYEIGMSHPGLGILYHCLNRSKGLFAERVFLPDTDLEALLRARGIPLTTLETGTPVGRLDLIGFSLAYELTYTNVLAILDLGGIPLRSEERTREHPVVLAGGPCACNPEPLAPFVDAFVIGEAEYLLPELCRLVREWRASGSSRGELLRALDRLESVYVPSLFSWAGRGDKRGWRLTPPAGRTAPVKRAWVSDLDAAPFPDRPLVPFAKVVHDRISIEVARGCPHACRFCQASVLYRPFRERSARNVLDLALRSMQATGYEELSLLALSIGDCSCLVPLVSDLMLRAEAQKVALSLPSLRVGSLDPEVVRQVRRVRRTGFTMAPEAATRRLRLAINKDIDEEELLRSARLLAGMGWRSLKLYFMIGLPTESDEDVAAIVSLAGQIRREALQAGNGHFQATVSVSSFVPKAHTPFQWHRQASVEEAQRKQKFLQRSLRKSEFRLKWHDARISLLEGVFARGNRNTSRLLEEAHRLGCSRDGWTEHLRFDLWQEAFERTGLDPQELLDPFPAPDDPLPWEWVDPGVSRGFLLEEYRRACRAERTPFLCRGRCDRCGSCEIGANDVPWAGAGKTEAARIGEDVPRPPGAVPLPPEPAVPAPREGALLRIRLHYCKQGPMVCLGHLETIAVFQRAIRRSGIPVAFTLGEHPHPRMAFSPALPLGVESLAEFVDLWLTPSARPEAVRQALGPELPEGLEILAAAAVPLDAPSLEESIAWIDYEARFSEQHAAGLPRPSRADLEHSVRAFQDGQASLFEIRKEGRRSFMDLRPAVREIRIAEGPVLFFRIQRLHGSLPSPVRILEALLPPGQWEDLRTLVRKLDTAFAGFLGSSLGRTSGDTLSAGC
ncbi:MAG: TIGR03960 family B12-binding radical SAM protein [bacterium]